MVWKNLLRRKGRTLLTIIGIGVGVAAIITLGTLAQGLNEGYGSMLKGSRADLVVSQPEAFDISYSSVDETIPGELEAMPEVEVASGMLQGFVPAERAPYFFVFGYPSDSFVLSRFRVIAGIGLDDPKATRQRGKPVLIGSSAAELMDKSIGDTLRLTDRPYRIVGIYETGDAFEDSGAVLPLDEAQQVLGRPRQVSLVYLRLTDPALRQRVTERFERSHPDLSLTTTDEYADNQMMGDMLQAVVWGVAGLAILIGGVGMANAQLMAVLERTREIGVLRAVGWTRGRVLRLILSESLVVGFAGGALGLALGYALLLASSGIITVFGADATTVPPGLIAQAGLTVFALGIVGGLYPAWRASRLHPLEALRYEGGTGSEHVRRLPVGGMAIQSLWQRTGRTLLTVSAIGLTVGGVMALDAILGGTAESMTQMATGAGSEIMVRQADVADTSLSAVDERVGSKIETLPGVRSTSGFVLSAMTDPEAGTFLIILGYSPQEYAIRRFNVVEGERIQGRHQIMVGRVLADTLNKGVGDTIDVSGSRFRVTGIYESGTGWEEVGGVISLRDAQALAGRPKKVTMYGVKLEDPNQAPEIVSLINERFPDVHAALAGEFVEQMPDMRAGEAMINGISILAILVGGVGVLNTMLMAVLERTREIGVLRTMGWGRRRVMGMIMRESLLIGLIGGGAGIVLAILLVAGLQNAPLIGGMFNVTWQPAIAARALLVALTLGVFGGLYPALRASTMQPVEALRYE
jgi:ABC-type lipoprotein release transport system permease subunit